AVRQYAPQANYVSGSPDCGDTHYWEVWHGPKLFDAYRTQNGFLSEFGYQSFPEPKTVRAFTNASDRASVITPVMSLHQKSGGKEANQKMVGMSLNYFHPPRGFDETLWLSQIVQGIGIKTGAEYWRQTMPRSMGCIYWQYNDTWPGMSWSSVDYFGRWKALHYIARRFYAPLLVSGREHPETGQADLYVSSDMRTAQKGTLKWRVTDLAGTQLRAGQQRLDIPPLASRQVQTLDLQVEVKKLGAENLLTWLALEVDGQTVSENLLFLAWPKEMALGDPGLQTHVEPGDSGYWVTLSTRRVGLWCWLELAECDARFSDNFVHVTPDRPQKLWVKTAQPLDQAAFTSQLLARSLFDLGRPSPHA
ncbi:MAG TPA: glycoside hydrolase family 2 protein, partial [Verrucomicrobiae bacterium]